MKSIPDCDNVEIIREIDLKYTASVEKMDLSLLTKQFEPFAEELKCMICLNIWQDPVKCKGCHQIFCRTCIKKWILIRKRKMNSSDQSQSDCPTKCSKYEEVDIDKTLRNMLNRIEIKCANTTRGCQVILPYDKIFSHLAKCEFSELYICIGKGCGFKSKRVQMREHVTVCIFISFKCTDCFIEIKNDLLRKHLDDECQKRIITCQYCQAAMRFSSLKNHFKASCDILEKQKVDFIRTDKFFVINSSSSDFIYKNILEQEQIVQSEFVSESNSWNITTIIELAKIMATEEVTLKLEIMPYPQGTDIIVSKSLDLLNWEESEKMKVFKSGIGITSFPYSELKYLRVTGSFPIKMRYFHILEKKKTLSKINTFI